MKHGLTGTTPLLFLLLLVSGCAPFKQYRTQYDLCVNPTPEFSAACDAHALQKLPSANNGGDYLLGLIEFDDQGQLWDRKQMWSVMDRFAATAAKQDLLMVVFVHGWNHSAAPGDLILEKFREVLAKLSESEALVSKKTGLPERKVAGVYLGWRGGSITVPGVNGVTFWDRKNTASKVGHGGVPEVLGRLEQLKRDKDSTMNGKSSTRLAIIGHSFGAEVVYDALSQVLGNRFVLTLGPAGQQSDVGSFGDLVVLINPAFESLLFAPLSDMSTERGMYFKSQLPVMAVLTSDADYATRFAFPLGRFFSTVFEEEHDSYRFNAVTRQQETIDESDANMIALGHFGPYETHRLYPSADTPREDIQELGAIDSVRAALSASRAWENDRPGSKIQMAGLTLERSATSAGRNPYLVIKTDDRLITEHNDIDDPRLIEFIKQLVILSTQSDEQKALMAKAANGASIPQQ
ncbi:MAG TPA: esterase [Gallionella sp.]